MKTAHVPLIPALLLLRHNRVGGTIEWQEPFLPENGS